MPMEIKTHILIFYSSQNTLPKTWSFKATELYFLTVLETRRTKLKCHQSRSLSKDSRGEFFL